MKAKIFDKIFLIKAGLFFLTFFFVQQVSAQLEVTDANTAPFTPDNLITNVFLGEGVEVVSITYDGNNQSVGYFTGGENVIGIERGIIMSTGSCSTQSNAGPFGAEEVGNVFASDDSGFNGSDPDINSLATLTTFNLIKYTIVFKPVSDTVRFRYVFASEEYPEYACSSFNDIFGFFLSGPGINGPFQNNGINMALIPGTNLPVTINNIHPLAGTQCGAPAYDQFYNNNNFTSNQPVYDGFLDVFTAEAVVIPCEEYTIKLVIADVGDSAFDTGVFLEAKSFGAGSLQVEATTVSLDGTLAEGCSPGTLTFNVPYPLADDLIIDYNIIGTATNGTDYQTIPLDLFIPAGDTTIQVPIIAFEDGISEVNESIGIDIQRDPCNRDTFWIYIRDNQLVPTNLPEDTLICAGTPITLDATLPIPLPPAPTFTDTINRSISPTNTPVFSDINVFGVQPPILQDGVIQSVCMNINHVWVDDLDIFLISPGGQFIELTTDNGADGNNYTNTCFIPDPGGTEISFPGPFAPASAAPFNGNWLPEGPWTDLWDGDFPTNGTWRLQMKDDQNGFTGTMQDWTITFNPLYQLDYIWSPANGVSCINCPITTITTNQSQLYYVTVTDTYGCEIVDSVQINTIPVLPAPTIQCINVTTNSIEFTWDPIPGSTGYEVNIDGAGWIPSNNGAGHIVTGLTLNQTVTITVHGLSACDGLPAQISCSTPNCTAPGITIQNLIGTDCYNGNDGEVAISAVGSFPPFTFILDGGTVTNTTGVFTGLSAGTHTIQAVDTENCPGAVLINIPTPDSIELAFTVDNANCNGSADGSATVNTVGGTPNYSYQWSQGNQNTQTATGLASGAYAVTVTDANGCTATGSTLVEEASLLQLAVTTDSVNCFGGSDGQATVVASGGTGGFSFIWSDPLSQNTATAINLAAGNYTVTVADINNCTGVLSATIATPSEVTAIANGTDVNCFGGNDGTAVVVPSGGVVPYTFTWTSGQTQQSVTGLGTGDHFVTVSDWHGCEAVASVTLSAPTELVLGLSGTDVNCFGGNNGTLTATANGGSSGYQYNWSQVGAPNLPNIGNLPAGTYILTVTDINSCSETASFIIAQPAALELTLNPVQVACNGDNSGAINTLISGGIGTYNYSWTGPGSFVSTNSNIANIVAGTYNVAVTDSNGCTITEAETIAEPVAINITTIPDDVNCYNGNDGSINTLISGGTSPYNISWAGPGGFSANTNNIVNLIAGTYNITVTDDNNCVQIDVQNVLQPATPVLLSMTPTDTICFNADNGIATVSVNGGTPPYDYLWSNGQTQPTANNLAPGTYIVSITDAGDCVFQDTATIIEKLQIEGTLTQSSALCHNSPDGSASITEVFYGANSVPINTFSYQWNTPTPQNSTSANGLTGGNTYTVTITDQAGCFGVEFISIGNPQPMTAIIDSTSNIVCFDGSDGIARVASTGGTSPYSYLWGLNAGSQTTVMAEGLAAGIYYVTVTDINGCNTLASVALTEPSEITSDFETVDNICYGEAAGQVFVKVEGGVDPYQYAWSTGSTTAEINDLAAGLFSLTVTDANGCTHISGATILEPESPVTALTSIENVSCNGGFDGLIRITPIGGTPPYFFSLDGTNFDGTNVLAGLYADEYDLYVQDGFGCTYFTGGIVIEEPAPLQLELGDNIIINYGDTIQLGNQVENAVGIITFLWGVEDSTIFWCNDNGCAYPFISPLYQEDFTLTVIDENGCSDDDIITVYVKKDPFVTVPTAFTPNGDNNNDLLLVHGKANTHILNFLVYDRWGELVHQSGDFYTNDPAIGWDGNFRGAPMNPGVFVWYIEAAYPDGTIEEYKGNTTLLR